MLQVRLYITKVRQLINRMKKVYSGEITLRWICSMNERKVYILLMKINKKNATASTVALSVFPFIAANAEEKS